MPVYSWRRRPTRHFGDVWVPVGYIEVRAAGGKFQGFAVQIDSGAVVSLLRRSVAELLGIELAAGRRIELSGVGGASTAAYVHELEARFNGEESGGMRIPFAIAADENVPMLLGRLGVFDRLQVDFDASLRETSIAAPWLSQSSAELLRGFLRIDEAILKRWKPECLPSPANRVVARLLNRAAQLVGGARGLVKLHLPDTAIPLLRSLFELSLQFEYVLGDPEVRARQYEDFSAITRCRQMHAWIDQPSGPLSAELARRGTPERRERVDAECEAVRSAFTRRSPKKGRVWDKWYCMSVRDLARALQREEEYKRWYADWSAWQHGDPFSPMSNAVGEPHAVLMHCYCHYARILLKAADVAGLILTAEEYEFLQTSADKFT